MARCYLVTQKFNLFQFDLICGYVATPPGLCDRFYMSEEFRGEFVL